MALLHVRGAKVSSNEQCRIDEFIRAWPMVVVKSRKHKGIDANIADSKSVSNKEWYCKVCIDHN